MFRNQHSFFYFLQWNPKITTLPGLYLLTIFVPKCSVYALRMIPLVCSIINFYLITEIKSNGVKTNDRGRVDVLLDSLSLALLPPMFFFSLIYYTDVPSITTILLTTHFSMKDRHLLSALCGFLSVLMRQTNIVWIAGIFGTCAIDTMIARVYPKTDLKETSMQHLLSASLAHLKQPMMLGELILKVLKKFYGYILVILSFVAFLIINGSIVGEWWCMCGLV
jgi:alpha-1,2-glucosyltransferase